MRLPRCWRKAWAFCCAYCSDMGLANEGTESAMQHSTITANRDIILIGSIDLGCIR
ncbi:MAG: hypothetical protein IKS64_02770 [Muribaculaceae bacterium]|nr:hypothetical protein [Muribaculaceae bacterium]